jgi:Flp pilus assembly protein TadD
VAAGTLAGVGALAVILAHWHMRSLDERGRALVAEERYLPAIRVLSGVVAEAPGDARAHYHLGLAYAGVGLCGAASIHLEKAARLAPEYRRLRAGPGAACRNAAYLGTTGPVRTRGQD